MARICAELHEFITADPVVPGVDFSSRIDVLLLVGVGESWDESG